MATRRLRLQKPGVHDHPQEKLNFMQIYRKLNNLSNYPILWFNFGSLANISILSFSHVMFFQFFYSEFFFPDLNPGADQKVHQHRLDLGLTRFEVVPTDEDPFLDGQLDGPGYKSVLRGSIDVGASLQYTGHCKQCGGRNLCSGLMDRLTNKRERGDDSQVCHLH